jgi:hypothetical protein
MIAAEDLKRAQRQATLSAAHLIAVNEGSLVAGPGSGGPWPNPGTVNALPISWQL